jgi:hypothetical protein
MFRRPALLPIVLSSCAAVTATWAGTTEDRRGLCGELPSWDLHTLQHPEASVGDLCAEYHSGCAIPQSLQALDVTATQLMQVPELNELMSSGYRIQLSSLDLDNDGKLDIRALAYVGSAHCARSYFFKPLVPGQTLIPLTGYGWDMFAEEGRFCGDDQGTFIRLENRNYFLEQAGNRRELYALSRQGITRICSVILTGGPHGQPF